MSNITTNRQNFVILGESMKKYVKIVVLTLIVSIFGAIILFSSLFATINPYTMGSSTPDIASSLNEMLGGLIVFVVAIIGLGIATLVYYIMIIVNLGKVAQASGDLSLNKAYKAYLWSIISSFLCVIAIVGIFLSMIFGTISTVASMGSSADPVSAIMGSLISFLAVGLVLTILPIILQIIGVLALDSWTTAYVSSSSASPLARKLKEGIDVLKWGTILSVIPFVSGLAEILVYIGFYQFGDALVKEFGPASMPQPVSVMPIWDNSEITSKNSITISPNSVIPRPSFAPKGPVTTQKILFCPNCGENLEVYPETPRFCPKCGKNFF